MTGRRGPIGNHHDFLDAEKKSQMQGLEGDYTVMPGSRVSRDPADEVIGVDWIKRAHRNYKQMKLASIQVPTKSKLQKNTEAMADRARQRQYQKEMQKKQEQLDWIENLKKDKAMSPGHPMRGKAIKFESEFKKR